MSVRFTDKKKAGSKAKKRKQEKNHTMYEITVNADQFGMVTAAWANAKPKTDEDYMESAALRKLLRAHYADFGTPKAELLIKPGGPPATLRMENSTFRYLERAFKEARESGQVYFAGAAEYVVELMGILKNAKEIKPEDIAAAVQNSGNGSKNRVDEALASK